MINLHDNVAILIDSENVTLSYMESVLKISEYYGKLEICRAYGDWEKPHLSPWREKMDVLKIDCIQVEAGKNTADHRLLIEAGEILGTDLWGNQVNVFILVSGDGGFTSAYKYLQERGKQVIVIGNKQQTSKSLKEKFEHYYLEDLNEELSKLAELHVITPSEVREFFNPLFFAYHQITSKQYGWVSYSQLGTKLHEIVPDYKSKFGSYPLSEWLKNFEKDFESHEQMVRRIDTAPEMTRLSLMYDAFDQTQQDGRSHKGQFGKALRKIDSDYESRFGSKTLTEWLAVYPKVFQMQENYVYLTRK